MKRKLLYNEVIQEVPNAWKELKKHGKKYTVGIDDMNIDRFNHNSAQGLSAIKTSLTNKSYKFNELKPIKLHKGSPKEREILIGTISDRIVSRAILTVIKPLFDEYYSGKDFSLLKEGIDNLKGIPLAAKLIQGKIKEGHVWIFETDIKKFFDTIPKEKILTILRKNIKSKNLIALVEQIIQFQIAGKKSDRDSENIGIAQGSSLSPLLANIYLYDFDIKISSIPNTELIRYVDDLIVLCKTQSSAIEVYKIIETFLDKNKKLKIHKLNEESSTGKVKTRIINAQETTFNFLGLTFNHHLIDISDQKKNDIIDDIRDILKDREGIYGNLLEKTRKISLKVEGFKQQYSQPHYNTEQSLINICEKANSLLKKHFVDKITNIIGYNPFTTKLKLSEVQLNGIYKFLGLNISNKVLKSKKQK